LRVFVPTRRRLTHGLQQPYRMQMAMFSTDSKDGETEIKKSGFIKLNVSRHLCVTFIGQKKRPIVLRAAQRIKDVCQKEYFVEL
jgi:hypothetical protein